MQTFLINSSDEVFLEKEVAKIMENKNIQPINFHAVVPENSIGIEEVRRIIQILTLKPFGGGKRVVLIKQIDKATFEAQNALLKILEEPPSDSYIILTCANLNILLPTVISRCQVITPMKTSGSDEDNYKKGKEIFTKILSSSPGRRLLLSQDLSHAKEDSLKVLDQILSFLHKSLYLTTLNLSSFEVTTLIKKVLSAKHYIERNSNVKATVDILFLGFPKIEIKKIRN